MTIYLVTIDLGVCKNLCFLN